MAPGLPLPSVLRKKSRLTDTRYLGGIAVCGDYTVHVGGPPDRPCVILADAPSGLRATPIEP